MASEAVSADGAVVIARTVAMPAARAGDEPGRGKRIHASGLRHLPGRSESVPREAFECGSVVVVVVDLSPNHLELEGGFVDDIEARDLWDGVPRTAGGQVAGTSFRTPRRSRDLGGADGGLRRRRVGPGGDGRGQRSEGGRGARPPNGLRASRRPRRFGIECRLHRVQSP
jgi:hypothetical protein